MNQRPNLLILIELDTDDCIGYYTCVDKQLPIIDQEMARAEKLLRSLVGGTINTLTVNSLGTEDAPFLGLVVSKLSPIIGNLLERKIMEIMEHDSNNSFKWQRQDPDFPDVVLLDKTGKSTHNGYEVKAWYALSTELTGRFRESTNLLSGRNVRLVVVAWVMSHIVYGSPLIVDVLSVDAASVAAQRDRHYHKPPQYLTVEPRDTTARTRNLQQTNVNGYRIQESNPTRLEEAQNLVDGHSGKTADPHTLEAQVLNTELMNRFAYRLDTNFAKVDRIDHPGIEKFKTTVLNHTERGQKLSQWASIIKALNDDTKPDKQKKAGEIIKAIYSKL